MHVKSFISVGVILLFLAENMSALPAVDIKFRKTVVSNEIMDQMVVEKHTISIDSFLEILPEIRYLRDTLLHSVGKKAECFTCRFLITFLQQYLDTGASENDVGALAYKICTYFKIETPRVCSGVAYLFKGELTQVLLKVALDPHEVCSLVCRGCGTPVSPLHSWTVPPTPFPKPPVRRPNPPKPGANVTRVLHLSDVHIDPYYMAGSMAACGEPLCCREASGEPQTPEDAAGYWGDYRNCDVPLRTFVDMLEHINKTHKFDYVIWTGDIPPHDIWNNSRAEAVALLHEASQLVNKYLGHVPVFPALGNHESSPVNSFPIPTIQGNDSISWLYSEVTKAWLHWAPESQATLELGAYYTVPVYPGLRIISLNMNYCNGFNWWLLLNSTDPTGQLGWLVAQLQRAEDKGEKVHIIGHIPPGEPDCLAVWSKNYNDIINRYESTVTAQFFGHTHADEFEIFYEKTNSTLRPTNIAYIGPSVTTYDGYNPGYRIYTVDGNYPGSSGVVLDHETYIFNLTKANMNGYPEYFLEYSAKDTYNMSSLLPQDWHELTHRFEKDEKLFQTFYRYFYKLSDYSIPECDDICRKRYICRLRRAVSNDPLVC